jgi:hypothetical protein
LNDQYNVDLIQKFAFKMNSYATNNTDMASVKSFVAENSLESIIQSSFWQQVCLSADQVFYNNLNLSKLLVEIVSQQHLIQYFGCYDLLNFHILQKLVLISLAPTAVHLFLHLSGNNPGLVSKFLEDRVKSFKVYLQKLERVNSIDEAYIFPVPNISNVAEALPSVEPLRISDVDINQRLDGLSKDKVKDLPRSKKFNLSSLIYINFVNNKYTYYKAGFLTFATGLGVLGAAKLKSYLYVPSKPRYLLEGGWGATYIWAKDTLAKLGYAGGSLSGTFTSNMLKGATDSWSETGKDSNIPDWLKKIFEAGKNRITK